MLPTFKPRVIGEGSWDKPGVRTGLGKSDRPGSQGGCRKRDLFKEVRAPAFYPDGMFDNVMMHQLGRPYRSSAMEYG